MASFDGTVKETWRTGATVDALRARFLDLDAVIRATGDVQRAEVVGEGKVRFVLKTQSSGPYSFTPDYTVWYRREGDDVVWTTTDGNLQNQGRARFRPEGAGAAADVEQTITIELPIPRLAVGLVRPIVDRALAPGVRAWQAAMVKGL